MGSYIVIKTTEDFDCSSGIGSRFSDFPSQHLTEVSLHFLGTDLSSFRLKCIKPIIVDCIV